MYNSKIPDMIIFFMFVLRGPYISRPLLKYPFGWKAIISLLYFVFVLFLACEDGWKLTAL